MSATAAYEKLVARGCLCGTDRPQNCTLHGPGDNRGIRAFFLAGMPHAFPTAATCSLCGTEGLMYPSVPLDSGEIPAGCAPPPTLVCPCCSTPAAEARLVAEATRFGHNLNQRRVFGAALGAAA